MSFEGYTNCVFNAFQSHPKMLEIIKRKQDILTGISEFYNFCPDSVLYLGFNPAIMSDKTNKIYITEINKEVSNFLSAHGVKFVYVEPSELIKFKKAFDVVIALDEYFTFAESDSDQKDAVMSICQLAKEYVITTCKDYKNQEFKDREFSIPALIKNSTVNGIYLEFHEYSHQDRNSWKSKIFEIVNDSLEVHGPFNRRSMFFKQLAKFSSDAGAAGFTVHKNLMYKSLIKKNYEHVISIQMDNNGSQ